MNGHRTAAASERPVSERPVNELWQPASACGPDCLIDDEPFTAVSRARGAGRLAAAAGVMVAAVALMPVLPLLPAGYRARLVRGCARAILRALGVRVSVRGRLPGRQTARKRRDEQNPGRGAAGSAARTGALVVANHISWLDIVVLMASGRTRLVAKSEVRDWPVIGRIARYTGTVFVDRARPRRLPAAVAEVRAALAAGETVVVFPEGTTSCGRSTGRFRPAFFQAAVDTGAPVVPVTLRFRLPGAGPTSAAAFLADETLMDSLRRILRLPGLGVSLSCGSMIHPASGATRRSLASVAAMAVGGNRYRVGVGQAPQAPATPRGVSVGVGQAPQAPATPRGVSVGVGQAPQAPATPRGVSVGVGQAPQAPATPRGASVAEPDPRPVPAAAPLPLPEQPPVDGSRTPIPLRPAA